MPCSSVAAGGSRAVFSCIHPKHQLSIRFLERLFKMQNIYYYYYYKGVNINTFCPNFKVLYYSLFTHSGNWGLVFLLGLIFLKLFSKLLVLSEMIWDQWQIQCSGLWHSNNGYLSLESVTTSATFSVLHRKTAAELRSLVVGSHHFPSESVYFVSKNCSQWSVTH